MRTEDEKLYEELLQLFEEHKTAVSDALVAVDSDRNRQRLQRIEALLRQLIPAEAQEGNP